MPRQFRDAVAALDDLLRAAERTPNRDRNLVYPDYRAMTSDAEREAFHRVMAAAEVAQAVIVRRDRHAGPADIRFVSLADAVRLAGFLRRTLAGETADQAIATLRESVGPVPAWIGAIIDDIASAWAVRRAPYPGLDPGDVPAARKFLLILTAIDRGDHERGWDMRTFSQRACGDSKGVEAAMARLARVLRPRFNLPDAEPRELLAALGIEKFPGPVLLRGCLQLPGGTQFNARPYLGLPPEMAQGFSILGTVQYVLVIENLASFNRHAREVDDGGVLVYSGGFPSRATMAAIRRLDKSQPAPVPFFHWGDTDHHGWLILNHIRAAMTRPLRPHLMDRATGAEQEEIDPEPPDLTVLPETNHLVGSLL